jgi:hypothetical protein
MAAIEEGMQANPDNWFFTFHARDYHMEEARILLPDDASNTDKWYKLKSWAEDYPPAHQQLRRASLRGARCEYQPGTLLYSLGTALRLDDDELVEDLLTEHPDVDFWIADEGWEDHNWRGKIITGAWWAYYALDNDEQLGELMDYALEYNETLRSEGEHTYDWYLGFGNQMHVPLYRALTLAETGNLEEARAMMADFKPQGEFQRLYRDWLVLYTADDMEEELTHLARGSVLLLHTQNPDNPAAKALYALHQHRLGLAEEARAIVDSITEPPEDWIFGNGNLGSIERRLRAELGMGEREEADEEDTESPENSGE